MKRALRNEWSWWMGLGALAAWWLDRPRAARWLGVGAAALRWLPGGLETLRDRTVVVTGGSRGLGLALAEELLANGAKVILLARDEAELERAHRQLSSRPISAPASREPESSDDPRFHCLVCDVTSSAEWTRALRETQRRFGSIDVLINNAGAVSAGSFMAMNERDFSAQMDLHCFAALYGVQAVLPYFMAQGSGRIVNISSLGGKMPVPHMSPYCTSKYALAGLSETLSIELAKYGVHVTTIYPGLMRTGSPGQAVFKGDPEKEYAWFAVADSTPGLTISAAHAARAIVGALLEGRTQAVLSVPAKVATLAHQAFPETFAALSRFVDASLPEGNSTVRKTGAESRSWLDDQAWSQPFREILERARRRYNETDKFDADFNLNA